MIVEVLSYGAKIGPSFETRCINVDVDNAAYVLQFLETKRILSSRNNGLSAAMSKIDMLLRCCFVV